MIKLGAEIGSVVESAPGQICLEVSDIAAFEQHKRELSIGQYLLIAAGNIHYVLAVIMSVCITHAKEAGIANGPRSTLPSGLRFAFKFSVFGTWDTDNGFERGAFNLPVPKPKLDLLCHLKCYPVYSARMVTQILHLAVTFAPAVPLHMDGDRLFSRHLAIIGSTGSGKSCAVACIIHKVIGLQGRQNIYKEEQKNAHIVIFDIHSEYGAAFSVG